MKRTIILLTALAALIISTPMFAAATANLDVKATVSANCTISAVAMDFGSYDPLSATNAIATGTLNVACTKGAAATISLGNGGNFTTIRRMASPSGDFLEYSLYQPNGTTAWDTTNIYTYNSTTKASQAFTVNGKAIAGQNITVGAYADQVVATINY